MNCPNCNNYIDEEMLKVDTCFNCGGNIWPNIPKKVMNKNVEIKSIIEENVNENKINKDILICPKCASSDIRRFRAIYETSKDDESNRFKPPVMDDHISFLEKNIQLLKGTKEPKYPVIHILIIIVCLPLTLLFLLVTLFGAFLFFIPIANSFIKLRNYKDELESYNSNINEINLIFKELKESKKKRQIYENMWYCTKCSHSFQLKGS